MDITAASCNRHWVPSCPPHALRFCVLMYAHLNVCQQVEFKKWCPAFKLLTYYGSAKERKIKRLGWSKPNAFHICITSYTLILQVGP